MRYKYRLVWQTKYRKPVLYGKYAQKLRDLIREICVDLEVDITGGSIKKDCIQLIISASLQLNIPNLMQKLKGKSAFLMFSEYAELKKLCGGNHLWARGYLVKTSD